MSNPAPSADKTSCAGTVALEYGFVFPILLSLVLGVMDISRLIWTVTSLNRAVEAAARCAAVNTVACGSSGEITARAVQEAWGLNVSASAFTATTQACGMEVSADYEFDFLVPWPGTGDGLHNPNTIRLTPSACYPN